MQVSLNHWAATRKLAILESLRAKNEPSEGEFDRALFRQGIVKGPAQAGSTRYEPDAVHLEFIFPDTSSTSTVLTVTLVPPERIVYMPVPDWVIEDIWQGSVSGSYHFESDALALAEEFSRQLAPANNPRHFEPAAPARRE